MLDANGVFSLTRLVTFGIAILFAVITMAMAAAVTNWTDSLARIGFYSYAALAIATAILTLLTLPPMLFFSLTRKGSFVSIIALEFGWTAFLWIMWLAVGGSAADTGFVLIGNCGEINFLGEFAAEEAACRETQAIAAFGFLTWLLLMSYNIWLLVLIVRQHLRGNSGVWTGYINDVDFNAPGNAGPGPIIPEAKVATPEGHAQYPPQPQHQYAQQPQITGQSMQQPTSAYPQV